MLFSMQIIFIILCYISFVVAVDCLAKNTTVFKQCIPLCPTVEHILSSADIFDDGTENATIFATSETFNGKNIYGTSWTLQRGADCHCQRLAELQYMSGSYVALLSGFQFAAYDNDSFSAREIVTRQSLCRLLGSARFYKKVGASGGAVHVATCSASYDPQFVIENENLTGIIDRDETGELVSGIVWTGSDVAACNLGDDAWFSSSSAKNGYIGNIAGDNITFWDAGNATCQNLNHLYCAQVSAEPCIGPTCVQWAPNRWMDSSAGGFEHVKNHYLPSSGVTGYVFATSEVFSGADASQGHDLCQIAADAAGLLGVFNAFLSTDDNPYPHRAFPPKASYKTVRIAGDQIDNIVVTEGQWSWLSMVLDRDEWGQIIFKGDYAWVGLDKKLQRYTQQNDSCLAYTTDNSLVYGHAAQLLWSNGGSWIDYYHVNCSTLAHLICVQVSNYSENKRYPFWNAYNPPSSQENEPIWLNCESESIYSICPTNKGKTVCSNSNNGVAYCVQNPNLAKSCVVWQFSCLNNLEWECSERETAIFTSLSSALQAPIDELNRLNDSIQLDHICYSKRAQEIEVDNTSFCCHEYEQYGYYKTRFQPKVWVENYEVGGFIVRTMPRLGSLWAFPIEYENEIASKIMLEDPSVVQSYVVRVNEWKNASLQLYYQVGNGTYASAVAGGDDDFFMFQLTPTNYNNESEKITTEIDYFGYYLVRLSNRLAAVNRTAAAFAFFSTTNGPPDDGDGDGPEKDVILAIAAVVLFVCALTGTTIFVLRRRNKRLQQQLAAAQASPMTANVNTDNTYDRTPTPSFNRSTGSGVYSNNAVDAVDVPSSSAIDARFIIAPSDVVKGKKIGQGAYGFVYVGKWRHSEVAVKEVNVMEEMAAKQLIDEAVAMSKMRPHQNIVTLYGVIMQPPMAIITEFCRNGSLDDKLYGKKDRMEFSDEQLVQIVIGVARGIAHLHADGIIHRDLAARNVLLDANFVPKVADFGMLRATDDSQEEATTKSTVGPVKWMAPEQLTARKYSKASDIYSFGVIIYECFNRSPPWPGKNNIEVIQAKLKGEALESTDRIPPKMATLMHACFALDASARPTSDLCLERLESEYEDFSNLGASIIPPSISKKKGGGKKKRSNNENLYGAPPLPPSSVASSQRQQQRVYEAPPLAQSFASDEQQQKYDTVAPSDGGYVTTPSAPGTSSGGYGALSPTFDDANTSSSSSSYVNIAARSRNNAAGDAAQTAYGDLELSPSNNYEPLALAPK